MIKKLIHWWKTRKGELPKEQFQETFTREEVIVLLDETRQVAYNDGKRDGLNIAREQATKSLKEILWQQNQNQSKTK